MLTTAALCVLWGVLLWGVLLSLRAAAAARVLDRRRRRVPAPATAPHVVLLVPALREQELLGEVVRAAAGLSYPPGLLHVVVVTTEREERERRAVVERLPALAAELVTAGPREAAARLTGVVPSGRAAETARLTRASADPAGTLRAALDAVPTTREVAAKLLPGIAAEHPGVGVHHLHYRDEGAKSSQLVHAVERLPGLLPPEATPAFTYVGLYDADSQPDLDTLTHLAAAVSREGAPAPDLVQQLPLQLRRPHAARRGPGDLVLRAHALADLRRRAGVEAYRIMARRRVRAARLPAGVRAVAEPVVYGVGAGLFVRHDTLVSIGMYEEPVDDLLVGYKLSSAGAVMEVLPVFNLVDRYSGAAALGKAYALVAHGSLAGCRRLLTDPVLRAFGPRNTVVLVKEGLDTLWWFAGPAVVTAAAGVLLALGAHGPLLVWAAAAGAYTVLHARWCVRRARRWLAAHRGADARAEPPGGPPDPLLYPAFLLQPLLHWAGPVRHLARVLRGRPAVSGKTER
ncbi:hypothetical protein GCM10010385_36450 [Streptomyces geysiriensis]|uniref:hypothetical protein n=1 Tax=Streptomyces TaxID=1883 RepID=UPI000FC3265F|nr:hypothetical protein [Streptomyces sp. WAC06128]RSS75855.1 hypothetical protein EF911_07120 [Streptomyces sp. WAC06128]GGY83020.1 hypothetical protein GCM10010385_36450 [Streptomyces geysiriensis]